MTWEWVAFSLIAAILLIFVVASIAQTVQKIAEAKYRDRVVEIHNNSSKS